MWAFYIFIFLHSVLVYAQIKSTLLGYGHRNLLETGEIVRTDFFPDDAGGSYGSESATIVVLEGGVRAIWKAEEDHANHEIAASVLSDLLGLDLVPLTVPRVYNGRRGSLQFWVEKAELGRVRPFRFPPEAVFFDYLINQADGVYGRPKKNILLHGSDVILIDNQLAFQESYRTELEAGWRVHVQFEVHRAFNLTLPEVFLLGDQVERIESISDEKIQLSLKNFLPPQKIESVITRRNFYLQKMKAYQKYLRPRFRCEEIVSPKG